MYFINKTIISFIPYLPKSIVQIFSKKYVAGTNDLEALKAVKSLNNIGESATIDILGEHTLTHGDSKNITNNYIKLLKNIDDQKIDCNLSIKPSHIGADLSYKVVFENFKKVLETANRYNNFIRIDMESSQLTDITIKLYEDLKPISNKIGIVFQAYLHRTEKDIVKLNKGSNIRLCKGIYKETEDIAFQDYNDINNNYIKLLKIAFEKGMYVGIATHDKKLIEECIKIIEIKNIPKDRFEFQYLYGVPMNRNKEVYKKMDSKIRSYVPYGEDWYEYSIRRIKENPKIASYVLKNILFRN